MRLAQYESLKSKVVCVTGASGAIGSSTGNRLAACGAKVACVDVVESEPPEEGQFFHCNVTRSGEIEETLSEILDHFGGLDAVVNNAGITHFVPFPEVTEEQWLETLEVNLTGAFLFSRAAVRHWLEKGLPGCIVNVTSLASRLAFRGGAAYNASKAGLLLLTKSMAMDLARRNIRVNAVAPGAIETAAASSLIDTAERRTIADEWVPLGMGAPETVADAICFLISDEARYITGHELVVDGGLSLGLEFPDFGERT